MSIVELHANDFDRNGKLLISRTQRNPLTNTQRFRGLTVVMVHGDFCGYCKQFMPVFQHVADQLGSMADFATLQIDNPAQPDFGNPQRMRAVLRADMPGVPYVVRFFNGHPWGPPFDGNRDVQSLAQWVLNSFQH